MKRIQVDFTNRKYRMLMWELCVFILFMALGSVVTAMFPLTTEPVRAFDNNYWLYYGLMTLNLGLFGAMFFIGGIWFNDWRRDKDIQLVKNLAMADLSSEEKEEPTHSY